VKLARLCSTHLVEDQAEEVRMHDIDSTRLEFGAPAESAGYAEYGEAASPFGEMQEIELASELLEIGSELELEQFLGNILNAVGGAARRFASSQTGQALGGILKDAARQALPVVGKAVGQWVTPSGGDVGAQVATQAGKMLGLELEGLSAEDREFEVARQFVRFAGAAGRAACQMPPHVSPDQAARSAAVNAAQTFAPGLMHHLRGRSGFLWPRSGRWVREGRSIVLYG
jgi:hypothetical protein